MLVHIHFIQYKIISLIIISYHTTCQVTSENRHRYIGAIAKYHLYDRLKKQAKAFFGCVAAVSSRCVMSYHVKCCHVMPCHIISSQVLSCDAMSCDVMSCHVITRYVILSFTLFDALVLLKYLYIHIYSITSTLTI